MSADKSAPGSETLSGAELLRVFKRGVQFTEELMAENERLRFRVVQLEEENRSLAKHAMASGSYGELLQRVQTFEEERKALLDRFRTVETENQDFQVRYQEIEDENNRLANLYVASFVLHSSLKLKEVVQRASEILINLVGTRDFALYILNGTKLEPVRAEGRPLSSLPVIRLGRGIVGRAARDGALYLSPDDELTKGSIEKPKACVPLVVGGKAFGLFVVFGFLTQKSSVTELDRELFKLLGAHAATAIYSARLNVDSSGLLSDAASFVRLLNS